MMSFPTNRFNALALMVCLLLGAGWSSTSLAEDTTRPSSSITLGETLQSLLPDGEPYRATAAFEFLAPLTGPMTVDARSLEFDTHLRLLRIGRDGTSTLLRLDDDSGAGTDSRILFDVVMGERYRVEVQAEWYPYCGRRFEIAITPGHAKDALLSPEKHDYVQAPRPVSDPLAAAHSRRADEIGSPECRIRALLFRSSYAGPVTPEALAAKQELLEQARKVATESLSGSHPAAIKSGVALGNHMISVGDVDAGIALIEETCQSVRQAVPAAGVASLDCLEGLIAVYGFVGDLVNMKEALLQALALSETILGPEHFRTIGLKIQSTNEPEILHASAELTESQFGPDHVRNLDTLDSLRLAYRQKGNLAKYVDFMEKQVALAERTLGPSHPATLSRMTPLANAYQWTGDLSRSIHLRWRLIDSTGGIEKAHWVSLLNLAVSLVTVGEFEQAKRLFDDAESRAQEDPLLPRYGGTLEEYRATLPQALGDHAAAIALNEVALEKHITEYGNDAWQTYVPLVSLGEAHLAQGAPAIARDYLERALRGAEKWGQSVGTKDHPAFVKALLPLGQALLALGEPDQAKIHLDRAERIQSRMGGETLSWERADRGYYLLARTQALLGRRAEAFSYALRAEKSGREFMRLVAHGLPERVALAQAASRDRSLDLLLSLLAGASEVPQQWIEQAWDSQIRSRSVVLDETSSRRRGLHGLSDPETTRLFQELLAVRARLAGLALTGAERIQSLDQVKSLVETTQARADRLERSLAAKSDLLEATSRARSIGLAEVGGALPGDSALVGYVQFLAPVPGARSGGDVSRAAMEDASFGRYAAFVMRGGSAYPAFIPLAMSSDVDRAVEAWRGFINARERLDRPRGARKDMDPGMHLRRLIWEPLLAALGDARRVFVVPAGSLNLVNLSSLPDGQRGFIVESGPMIHYLSAERELVPGKSSKRRKTLVALGGPDFDAIPQASSVEPPPVEEATKAVPTRSGVTRSSCPNFRNHTFQPLGQAESEVQEIGRLWNQEWPGGNTAPVTALTGAAARESAFRSAATEARILHIATHGFFLNGACNSATGRHRGLGGLATSTHLGTGGVAAPSAEPEERRIGIEFYEENPLLLSGLALAGANNRDHASDDEDDGILTAAEIAAMDLSGVEWAVLSACETGVGEIKAGEGVFGLRRAFQVAGADTLIMSLWSVEDEATRAWMKALYEGRLIQKMSTADAVRHASLTVLNDRREKGLSDHPFYWAAFVAAGDWR